MLYFQMAMLFGRDEKTIRKHVNNVFSEGELEKENNTHFLRVVGVKQPVAYYNLDVIISVGYRVKSQRGVKFRQWANRILKQYLVKGYAVNDRLRRVMIISIRLILRRRKDMLKDWLKDWRKVVRKGALPKKMK